MKISHKKEKLLLLLGYGAILCVFWFFKLPCLFQHFLGIPCPGCGMTRAVLAALRLDFAEAFSYHAMFWSLPLLFGYLLIDGGLFRKRWINIAVLVGIGIGFLAVWAKKMLECIIFC